MQGKKIIQAYFVKTRDKKERTRGLKNRIPKI